MTGGPNSRVTVQRARRHNGDTDAVYHSRQRAPTATAERRPEVPVLGRTVVVDLGLTVNPSEIPEIHEDARSMCRAVGPAAAFAVTMHHPPRPPRKLECDLTAQATAANRLHTASCCGNSSVMVCQEAFEPTKRWLCAWMPNSPSRLPAGQNTTPVSGSTTGVTEPHWPQNVRLP